MHLVVRHPVLAGSAEVVYQTAEGKREIRNLFQDEVPETFMSEYKEIVGDGLASVSVGIDMAGGKSFGNGAGGMVNVKLTCDQSESAINKAWSMASSLAAQMANQSRIDAEDLLRREIEAGHVYRIPERR